ncbi:MAG: hypothetical protein EXS38_11045 [Opitutus sp.]|nr:hypothetical protein [Opitutus sp.]
MDDDSESVSPASRPKMSLTPSWLMLGFVLGVLFVVALPSRKVAPVPSAPERLLQPAPPPPLQVTTIEAVFADWGAFAVWENEITEVALWNTERNDFVDFYEVRRFGDTLYFRTMARLTRRIVNRGKLLPENCPLLFTETEEHYREWLRHGSKEQTPEPRPASRPVSVAPGPANGGPPMVRNDSSGSVPVAEASIATK